MSNGSGVASRPGHTLLVGADPNSEDGFTQWVNSIHPAFEATALGKGLIAEGFDNVHDAHLVTVELLRTDFDLKSGHAAKFVEAAHAMQAPMSAASVMGEVVPQPVWPLQFALPPKRTHAPLRPDATLSLLAGSCLSTYQLPGAVRRPPYGEPGRPKSNLLIRNQQLVCSRRSMRCCKSYSTN